MYFSWKCVNCTVDDNFILKRFRSVLNNDLPEVTNT